MWVMNPAWNEPWREQTPEWNKPRAETCSEVKQTQKKCASPGWKQPLAGNSSWLGLWLETAPG